MFDHETTTTLVRTRASLHPVAEHVLAPARYDAEGRIGLRAAPGGFGTPPYPSPAGARTARVDGLDLVVLDDGGERRQPLTTLGAAAAALGIVPGAPTHVYTPTTPLEADRPLDLDPTAAGTLAEWFALVDEALAQVVAAHAGDEPAEVQLWPEHFDLATTIREVNVGGSPGDADHDLPYLYVGPWSPPEPDGGFWNEPFGASRPVTAITSVADAVAFFETGLL